MDHKPLLRRRRPPVLVYTIRLIGSALLLALVTLSGSGPVGEAGGYPDA
ncbi:MAG: hypothetical protein ACOCZH_00430 [Phototrophicaceae bacterium]